MGLLCFLLLLTSLTSLFSKESSINPIVKKMYSVFRPSGNLHNTFLEDVRANGNTMVLNEFGLQDDIYEEVGDGLEYLEFETDKVGNPFGINDNGKVLNHFVTVPFLIDFFNRSNFGTYLDYFLVYSNNNSTLSIPDYKYFSREIRAKLDELKEKKGVAAKVFINLNTPISLTQVLNNKMDSVVNIDISYRFKTYQNSLDYIVDRNPSYTSKMMQMEVPIIHVPIPNSSFQDYIVFLEKSAPGDTIGYSSLPNEIHENESSLAQYRNESIYDVIRETENSSGSDKKNIAVYGVEIPSVLFFYVWPSLVVLILFLMKYYIGEYADNVNSERLKQTIDDSGFYQKKVELFNSVLPIEVGRKLDFNYNLIWLYLFFFPGVVVVVSVFSSFDITLWMVLVVYIIAGLVSFFLVRNIILSLTKMEYSSN